MHEPRPNWSPLGVNFKILDEHPHLFYISSSPPPPPGSGCRVGLLCYQTAVLLFDCRHSCFGNFDSTVSIDVNWMKSYVTVSIM